MDAVFFFEGGGGTEKNFYLIFVFSFSISFVWIIFYIYSDLPRKKKMQLVIRGLKGSLGQT